MTLWCYTTCLFKNPGFLNEAEFSGENTTEYEIRYALLMCCNCCFVVIFKIITCIKSQHNFKAEVNTISSLIFGMIALVMLVDQYCAIKTNTTGIELLKNIKGKTQPFHESLIEVFETPFSYLWLLPVNRKVQKNLSVSANFTQKKNKSHEVQMKNIGKIKLNRIKLSRIKLSRIKLSRIKLSRIKLSRIKLSRIKLNRIK
ncbi:palmitoyltransferase DHHC11 [Plasmodium brasilianum]|uniref:Palmitoyltransferase DHHC11 n=1 Tax=Plasmodium brasilianum TaxID=5824 RepID=A0ACB9YFI8_PLABR|nr:palmitoyltransferase DHHC11 [Plasmodium brasilianum]